MDIKRLIRDADSKAIVTHLGVETVEKGSKVYIPCPGHEARLGKPDMNIGNAVLKKGGYKCYACGDIFVKNHDMVMEITGCSSEEAYITMAEAMGGIEFYDNDSSAQDNKGPKYRLSVHEAEVIGLYPKFTVAVMQRETRNGLATAYDGLNILYQKNPCMYYTLIVDKAKEMLEQYSRSKLKHCAIDAPQAHYLFELLGDDFDNSIYHKLEREIEERINTCQKIINIFSTAIHEKPVT